MAINWNSPAGGAISFEVFNMNGEWNHVSGIYMFCRQESNGSYTPLYIGQAESFRDRLTNHEQWLPAVHIGASVVLAGLVPTQANRDKYEQQLIQQFQPPLNVHFR